MTRKDCVCGRVGFEKCPVHGDPVKGPALMDEEFMDLVVRNRGAIQEVFFPAKDAIDIATFPFRKPGRPRKAGGAA